VWIMGKSLMFMAQSPNTLSRQMSTENRVLSLGGKVGWISDIRPKELFKIHFLEIILSKSYMVLHQGSAVHSAEPVKIWIQLCQLTHRTVVDDGGYCPSMDAAVWQRSGKFQYLWFPDDNLFSKR
jgi:hypothetical protein